MRQKRNNLEKNNHILCSLCSHAWHSHGNKKIYQNVGWFPQISTGPQRSADWISKYVKHLYSIRNFSDFLPFSRECISPKRRMGEGIVKKSIKPKDGICCCFNHLSASIRQLGVVLHRGDEHWPRLIWRSFVSSFC